MTSLCLWANTWGIHFELKNVTEINYILDTSSFTSISSLVWITLPSISPNLLLQVESNKMCSHCKWLRSTRHLILLIDRNELQNVKVISYLKKSNTEVDKTTRSIFLALTFMYIPFPPPTHEKNHRENCC